jgi:putative toxin-antitoxin system antitoxin component (TIGR02293 family)
MSAMFGLARPKLMPNALDMLVKNGFSNDEIYKIVAPRRTLARRKAANEQLSVVETDRVLRLQRVLENADRTFGDPEKARRWLRKPNRAMDLSVPIEMLETEHGARLVEEELGRIRYGMFA